MNRLYLPYIIILFIFIYDGMAQPLQKLAISISESEPLRQAQWAAYAEYIDSGEILVAFNSDKSVTPASGLKLLTSAAALDYLGENFRYRTKIFHSGSIRNGVLKGDIIIRGEGDPTLGSNQVKGSLPLDSLMASWSAAIKKLSIKKIEGSILSDDYLFDRQSIPDFWNWRDMGNYYAAGTAALTIHENLYYLILKPGSSIGAPVKILRTKPEIPGLEFINKLTTASRRSGDNAYLYAAPRQRKIDLTGTIPIRKKEFTIKGSLPNPPLFAARQLKKLLQKNGVNIKNKCRIVNMSKSLVKSTLIAETISPPLKDIIFRLNKRSINLYAEQLVKTIAVHSGKKGSFKNGLKLIKKFLKKYHIPLDGISLHDGSGLSRTNTITACAMVKLLKTMYKHPAFSSYYNSLGIAGCADDIGFFASFGKGTALENNARIKSGLLPGVRSHSGYLQDSSGKWIAFSLIANNYNASVGKINKQHLRLLKALAKLKK